MEEQIIETQASTQTEALAVKEETTAISTEMSNNIWGSMDQFKAAYQMANVLAKADIVPQSYKGKPNNCLIALDFAQRMNISPMMVMQSLYIVQGNPSWSGQACVALINNCGRFKALKFDEKHEGNTFSCTAYAEEIKTGEILRGTTVDTALMKSMGWDAKSGSYWLKMPHQMARYRAAAYFARAYCPEALMGLYTADEQADIHQTYEEEYN